MPRRRGYEGYAQQADAAISQANPVSDTVYPVLAATPNVMVIAAYIKITWAVTQPTNLRIIVTVDGKAITYTIASPVTATAYFPVLTADTDGSQLSSSTIGSGTIIAMSNISGRSVQVDAAITWAVTQPTPLVCRVKYAKR